MSNQGFEPGTDVLINVIPIDKHLEATPLENEATLLVCPDGTGQRLELLSVSYRTNTLPVDSGVDIDVDIEFIDDSASDAVTQLRENFDLKGATVLVMNEVWRGSQILDQGDAINAEFTVSTPTTASEGAALIVEYRVVQNSASGSGFDPNTNVGLIVIPTDAALEQTVTANELCLLGCPLGVSYEIEMLSVNFRANTLPVDASNNVNIDIESIDDSDSDAVANIVATVALDDSRTALVNNELWRGSHTLDPGDVVNAEFDVSTPDTASEGAAFIIEYRINKRSY